MAHKFDPGMKETLDEKEKVLPSEYVIKKLGVKPEDVFVDVGSGLGNFAIAASKYAKVVYATEISEDMLHELKKRTEGIENIKPILTDEYNTDLPESSYALLSNVLHEVDDKKLLLENVKKSLSKGGRIVVIDAIKADTPFGPPIHHRISEEEARDWLEQAGYKDIESVNLHAHFFCLTATN